MKIRSFRNEKKKQYYFKIFNANEEQVLKSEAYGAKAGRDNGINSFKKNAPIPERYERLTSADGKFYFNIKADNHQIIATSLMFDSKEKNESVIAEIIAYASSVGEKRNTNLAATPKPTDEKSGSDVGKEQDDYNDLSFYENSGTKTGSGFDRFQKGADNYYYFSFKSDDGKVLLLSQGYKAEAGRDNGIASVEKNGKIEKRYTHHTTDAGKFFFTLKAGNHQEIARSADFDTEDEMKKALAILMNGGGAMVKAEVVKAAPKSSKDGMDDYRTFGFYKDSGTDVKNGWDRFHSEKNNEYYFSYKVDGEPVLISEGYTTEAARENGIASVEKNWSIDKRYKHHETPGGRYYYTIRAGNHQEIARSKWYSSAKDRDGGVSWLLAGGLAGASAINLATSAPATPPAEKVIKKTAEAAPAKSVEVEDDYLPCKEYEGHEVNDKKNNIAFFKHKNGQFYFVVYKSDGSVRLRSEGFQSAKVRDEELSGVLKNLDNKEMYETTTRGKYSIYVLKDKTGREVGRSCLEAEKEKVATAIVEAVAATAVATAVVAKVTEVEPAAPTPKKVEDDYLPCREYEGHKLDDKKNNTTSFKHENGQFYFVVYKSDGNVRLRSKGFATAKGRDEELSGVLKNLDNKKLYKTISRGKYFMHVLKDKTGREVGRSCLEKEKEKIAPPPPIVEAVAATAVAAAVVSKVAEVKPAAPKEKADDYLPCQEYEEHKVNDTVNNVAFFKHKNGQFYFAIYKEDGSVRLRSEGFEEVKNRDVELSGVLKNIDNPEMYETLSKGKYRIHILSDATGREVGRSCLETIEEKVTAAPPVVEAVAATAIAAAAVAAIEPEPKPVVEPDPEPDPEPVVEVDKEDDYLLCKEYENRKISNNKNKVALFRHSDDQLYFAIYKSDGTVRLRSEGFKSSKKRDRELSSALKNLENANMYETVSRGKYSLHILKDKKGREVGRSCLETESNPLAMPVVAAATAAVSAAVIPDPVPVIKVEKEVITPVAPVAVKKPAKKKAPPVVAAATAAAEGGAGGFNWKWLLLLLPLLLAFVFWKGCNGCANTPIPPAAVTDPTPTPEPTPAPAPVDTAKVETVPVPVPEPEPQPLSCNCTGSSNKIFNIPSNKTPRVLTRLGTNPEFGNSHNLDAAGFYNKLKNAHATNNVDKRFLNDLFKAMGYENGFAGASANLFSETRLSRGTNGNMGSSKQHLSKYSKLNTSGKDLEAFKIKAANGCDIHFMKTCGNHFFFCPK